MYMLFSLQTTFTSSIHFIIYIQLAENLYPHSIFRVTDCGKQLLKYRTISRNLNADFFEPFFPPFQQCRLKERGKWLLHLSQMSTYKCYMFRYFSDPMTQNLIPSWIHIITLYIVVLSSRLFTTKGVW